MPEAPRFGTSGLRGLVTELTDDLVVRYTRAFLRHLGTTDRLLIGRDLRDSSERIAAACAAGATVEGLAITDCGALPTPALALEAMRLGVPAIMVTGSHIPADRNGLKFYRPDGEIDKADEAGIVEKLAEVDGNAAASDLDESSGALDRYVARYTALAPSVSLRGARIGVYQHSTVARDILVRILEALGAEVVPLGRADGFVPVDTEALRAEDVALVHGWSAEHGLDAIVSADGDGDRPLIADENGVFLRGDVVGLLTARFLAAKTVVTPVTSTSAVEISGSFPTVVRTKVGSPHVIGAMEGANVAPVVGFEANGGVLLGSEVHIGSATLAPLPTRDALLPIIAVLASDKRQGRSLAALVAGLPQRHTASGLIRDMPLAESAPFIAKLAEDHAFAADLTRHPVASADTTDGTKLALVNGDSVHFRASGNAPELRCYVESGSSAGASAMLEAILERARNVLGKR